VSRRKASEEPTPRELELLVLMSRGAGYAESGVALGITVNSVRTFVFRLFRRIGAHDAHHAVRIGFERGWLVAADPGPYPDDLREKDLQLLRFLSFGLTHARIATRIGLKTPSVSYRKRQLLRKLRVTDSRHAVRKGFEHGLLQHGDPRD
jgi:DNA-binding CsgD family transcriptional regulator